MSVRKTYGIATGEHTVEEVVGDRLEVADGGYLIVWCDDTIRAVFAPGFWGRALTFDAAQK